MNTQAPIGIFDSGVGGTSIWKEIHQLLPNESTIYLADSLHAPYGNKTKEEIIALCVKNTEELIKLGSKIIVVACNTATTNAISYLREHYKIPFIGIEPAIKPASLHSKTKSIGILATQGTLSSDLFYKTSQNLENNIKITEIVGKGLVPLIEDGAIDDPQIIALLNTFLKPMVKANIDHLVLGCSHYPYLIKQLKEVLPAHIKIIDSGEAVARQTQHILKKQNWLNLIDKEPELVFYSNKETTTLEFLLKNYKDTISIFKSSF